jgi:uncharacterized Zn finger protein
MSWERYSRYVPVAERRVNVARQMRAQQLAGRDIQPVRIAGNVIAKTFWGKAWCKNLEDYSDYANRLPRGRRYVRNGSVVDLQIDEGQITAQVSGSDLYTVQLDITPLPSGRWHDIRGECAGHIDSLVDLLQGDLSKGVMQVVTRRRSGLFPSPNEITLSCSCPDWATMCKHVAATMYGVGARLDRDPQLLFLLRGVDPSEMIETAIVRGATGEAPEHLLANDDLASIFGLEIDFGEDFETVPEAQVEDDERQDGLLERPVGLSDDAWAVMDAIIEAPGVQLGQLVEWLEMPKMKVRKALTELKKRELVVFVGAARTGGWCLSD